MSAGEPQPDPSFKGARNNWLQNVLMRESASLQQQNRECLERPRLQVSSAQLLPLCHHTHALLERAMDGCEFADKHWVEQRALALRRAVDQTKSGAGAIAQLADCLKELDSLQCLAIREGGQGRSVRPALDIPPDRDTPTNLVDALRTRERLTMSLSFMQPDRRPGKTLREEARQQLLTMGAEDLSDPRALPRHQEVLADAWRLIDAADQRDQDSAAQLANAAPWRLARYRG